MTHPTDADQTQRILDAMDGIAMILDADLRIRRIGAPNWSRFLQESRGSMGETAAGSLAASIGRPITAFMQGDGVRRTFETLFRSVSEGRRPALHLDYRCDAPDLRRDMRLSVTPVDVDGTPQALLYQSILLSAEPRAPIQLFDAEITGQQDRQILTLCVICHRVAWPVGAAPDAREWIEPAEYYRRGGEEVTRISHGFCEACFTRLTEEEAA